MKRSLATLVIYAGIVSAACAQTEFRNLGYEEALKAAGSEEKLLFMDFYTSWCGPCKKMAREVFPAKAVGEFMNPRFVSIKLDAEKDGRGAASRYNVKSYPTFIITDSSGKELARLAGAMAPDVLIKNISESLTPEMSAEMVRLRYEAGERDHRLVHAYAMQLMEARDSKRAVAVVDDHFASLTDSARLSPDNLYILTAFTMGFDNEKGRFMRRCATQLWQNDNKVLKAQILRLYTLEVTDRFTGRYRGEYPLSPEVYARLVEDIEAMSLNADGRFDRMLPFIEQRALLDDSDYLTYCREHYLSLSPAEREMLLTSLASVFPTADATLRKDMAKFIQKNIDGLSEMARQRASKVMDSLLN